MNKSKDEWENELIYINSIDPVTPGNAFNDDRECFGRYCDMQAHAAIKDGERNICEKILSRRDIALYHIYNL